MCSLRTLLPASLQPQLLLEPWLKIAQVQIGSPLQTVQAISLHDFYLVLSQRVHRALVQRLGSLRLDFRKCLKMPGCPDRRLPKGRASWATSTRAVQRKNTAVEPPHWRPPSCRSQIPRPTKSLVPSVGKNYRDSTPAQPMRAAWGLNTAKPQVQSCPRPWERSPHTRDRDQKRMTLELCV